MANGTNILFSDAIKYRNDVLKLFGKTDKDLKQDVAILRTWIEKQPHLPEVPCDAIIERILILCKFSIENAKQKLDMRYTIRGLIPDIYENRNPMLPGVIAAARTVYAVPLPKYTKEFCRVIIYKVAQPQNDIVVEDIYMYFLSQFEVRLNEDWVAGDVYVVDLSTSALKHLTCYTPSLVKKIFVIIEMNAKKMRLKQLGVCFMFSATPHTSTSNFQSLQAVDILRRGVIFSRVLNSMNIKKVFANRIKGIHYLNPPAIAASIISVTRSLVKPKIAKRIHIHKNWESFYKFVPREILPKDYGGGEMSLAELNGILKFNQKLWLKKLEEYSDHFDRLETLKVDESLRPEKLINDDILGFHGNFKKLDVD